jgi:hypothetical protein
MAERNVEIINTVNSPTMENITCVVWQGKEGGDLYRLANGTLITSLELEKLEALSPEKKWIVVVYKTTPVKKSTKRIDF